jgi:Domain of unknown function (DUF4034)
MSAAFLCAGCSKTEASAAPVDPSALVAAVHTYGSNHKPVAEPSDAAPENPNAISILDDAADYKAQVAVWLAQRNFDALDQEARTARASKARMRGGVWKLYEFYQGVDSPVSGDKATDQEWKTQIATLNDWIKQKPDSAAARIALAGAYISYAGKARGTGYADNVSSSGWDVMRKRDNQAEAILLDAAKLPEKCPMWYEMMQNIALSEGWPKENARELFESAVAFEPDYYHYYREYANYLLPKWYGEQGEVETFATEAASRVKGKQGDFIYFEISSILTCQCDSQDSDMENLSWPRIKAGYAAMEEKWGTSKLKANRYAHMAVEAEDKPEARAAFEVIGDKWDLMTWHGQENFERARDWAMN